MTTWTSLIPLLLATMPGPTEGPSETADLAVTVPSNVVLSQLPDGETKRRFILDCTGCHQMEVERVYPDGKPRTEEQWRQAIDLMLSMAGASSSFPVISAERDPAATARWLAETFRVAPEPVAPPPAADVPIREYEYPYPGDLPHDLAVDAEGRVVITGMFTHRMLRLDPETGAYDEIPIPVEQANPRALEIDGQGRWWALLGAPHALARYEPDSGDWMTLPLGMYGHSVRVDDTGRAWFNGHFTSDPPLMGFVDPETGRVRTFPAPAEPAPEASNPVPYGLRVAPDGSVWGTELHGNRLVRVDPETEAVRAWRLPTTHSGPRRLDIAPDGTLWIPEYSGNALARFDPDTETFREYPLPVTDALPYIARLDARGRILVGTSAADAVLRFDPASASWETFPLPTRGVLIRHMDLDPRTGDLWVAYGASPGIPAKIARLRLGL